MQMLVGFSQRRQLPLSGLGEIGGRRKGLRRKRQGSGCKGRKRNESDQHREPSNLKSDKKTCRESRRQPTTFTKPQKFHGTGPQKLSYCIPIEVGVKCSYWLAIEAGGTKSNGRQNRCLAGNS